MTVLAGQIELMVVATSGSLRSADGNDVVLESGALADGRDRSDSDETVGLRGVLMDEEAVPVAA